MNRIPNRIVMLHFFLFRCYQKLHHLFVQLFRKKSDYKIFCIGFYKTGTNSVSKALTILGYRSGHLINGAYEPKNGWLEYIKKLKYDTYADYPLPEKDFYKKLDKTFPNSKFILTIRDKKSFEKSYLNYFEGSPWAIKNSEELKKVIKEYEEHNEDVISYFQKNPSQLLVMNVFEGDGWEKLCGFLGKPIPKKLFPHKNKGRYKK